MLTNSVGPQMVGAADLKSMAVKTTAKDLSKENSKDFKSSSSNSSFDKELQRKVSKADSKEMKSQGGQKGIKDQKVPENTEHVRKEHEPPEDSTRNENEGIKEQAAGQKGADNKKPGNRQQVIKEFMDSFESEFQIPPTRLVEAMAKLDDSQLKEKPEVSADAVIDQLDLDDASSDKARAMYASLLQQLQNLSEQKTSLPVVEKELTFAMSSNENMQKRVAAAQEKQNVLSSAIENLNKKFWTQNEAAPKQDSGQLASEETLGQNLKVDESFESEQGSDRIESNLETDLASRTADRLTKLEGLPPHLQGQMKDSISPALLAALAAQKAQSAQATTKDSVASESLSEEQAGMDILGEFQDALDKVTESVEGIEDGTVDSGKNIAAQNMSDLLTNADQENQGEFFGNSNQFNSEHSQQEKDLAKNRLTSKAGQNPSELSSYGSLQSRAMQTERLGVDSLKPLAGAAVASGGAVNGANHEAAVKQLMNQAQYLIKKGGGEVKVEMSPEGMGTIHLKVLLQDGKVNLQMSADTQEAKRTIESSLGDLKNSLAAHKLSIENVKVDVVNTTSADTAARNQTNSQGHSQRDQSRQFWNQFNENFGNQGRRESFTEMQGIKSYGGSRKGRDPLQPIQGSGDVKPAARIDGRGRGLNLVA